MRSSVMIWRWISAGREERVVMVGVQIEESEESVLGAGLEGWKPDMTRICRVKFAGILWPWMRVEG